MATSVRLPAVSSPRPGGGQRPAPGHREDGARPTAHPWPFTSGPLSPSRLPPSTLNERPPPRPALEPWVTSLE